MKLRTEPNLGTRKVTLSRAPQTEFKDGVCEVKDSIGMHLLSIDSGIKFIQVDDEGNDIDPDKISGKAQKEDEGEDIKTDQEGEDIKQSEEGEDIQKKSEENEPLNEVQGEMKSEAEVKAKAEEPKKVEEVKEPTEGEKEVIKKLENLKVDELKEIASEASETIQDGVDVGNLRKAELIEYLKDKV